MGWGQPARDRQGLQDSHYLDCPPGGGPNKFQHRSPSRAAKYSCSERPLHKGPLKGAICTDICMFICSIFVLQPCWLQRWIVGVFIMKDVWFMAVEFLSLTKSVHCHHRVTDGRVPQRTVSCPLPTCPRDSQVCPLLSAVLPVHPDHLLGRALSSHPGLHLQGKCTYLASCAPAHSWPAPPSPEGLRESASPHPVVPAPITIHHPTQ